jgi:hypothetical protein
VCAQFLFATFDLARRFQTSDACANPLVTFD